MKASKLRLDDYQLGPTIGVGTVGAIHAATVKASGDRVAIKLLHPSVSNDPLIRARFEREMVILSRLSHPNIIRYDGGGVCDGQLFYVMELVEGGTVRDLLAGGNSLTWQEVVTCTRQLCSALQCAHNHGVIHRDLKPANLFLTREGQIKLGDFGIALDTQSADLTGHGLTVGTHAYMAPEQITGDSDITGKADLYALGCCMFEMLTGHKPYEGENFAQLFEQHLRADVPHVRNLLPHCPELLDETIAKLMAKNPLNRPFNARQVQGVMLEIMEQEGLFPDEHAGPENAGPASAGSGSERSKFRATAVNGPDHEGSAPTGKRTDVGAEFAGEIGQQRLQRRITARLGGTQSREVSWKMLAVMVAAIILVIAAFALFSGPLGQSR